MRISDWSSDVCSSDLARKDDVFRRHARRERAFELAPRNDVGAIALPRQHAEHAEIGVALDREGDVLARNKIGRAHVCTPVTNAHLVCRLLLEKNKRTVYTTNWRLSRHPDLYNT